MAKICLIGPGMNEKEYLAYNLYFNEGHQIEDLDIEVDRPYSNIMYERFKIINNSDIVIAIIKKDCKNELLHQIESYIAFAYGAGKYIMIYNEGVKLDNVSLYASSFMSDSIEDIYEWIKVYKGGK